MMQIKQNRKKFVKSLYSKANMDIILYDTKDGEGFYIHPKNKRDNFLNSKGKGIFVNYDTNNYWNKKYLIEADDDLRRNLRGDK